LVSGDLDRLKGAALSGRCTGPGLRVKSSPVDVEIVPVSAPVAGKEASW
jgi:hypothetical protein